MKCIAFVVLCLIATLELSCARTVLPPEDHNRNSSEEKSGSSDESIVPLNFPKVISESDTRTPEEFDVENLSGFGGKVGDIDINSEENKPGVHAYGLPKKQIKGNGLIEIIPLSDDHQEDQSRSGRLVQAYGMERKRLESNGEIERMIPPSLNRMNQPASAPARPPRSPDSKENIEPAEDLEAQDSKVFRPLFVYRQQQARKMKKNSYKCHNGECRLYRSY